MLNKYMGESTATAELELQPLPAPVESKTPPETKEKPRLRELHRIIAENVNLIRLDQNQRTGLLPAADIIREGHCDTEHHYEEAWTRDEGNVYEALSSAYPIVAKENPLLGADIASVCRVGVEKSLELFAQPRWQNAFAQKIETAQSPAGEYTHLTELAPEVHFKTNGETCKGGKWDHNQPEAIADYLLAVSSVYKNGIIESYTPEQLKTIRTMAEYLIRTEPWHFEGSAMWEGLPGRTPSSRSNAIIIAKSIESVMPLFANDSKFQQSASETIVKTMDFVYGENGQGLWIDYTTPKNHPEGTDMAMIAAIVAPDSEKTYVPFLEYVPVADRVLKDGVYPGSKRFLGDDYYRSEKGEAIWFMGDILRSIGYFKEAQRAQDLGAVNDSLNLRAIGYEKLKQAIDVVNHYDYYPELFVQKDPAHLTSDEKEKAMIIEDPQTKEKIALIPNQNDLLWTRALMVKAAGMGLNLLDQETPLQVPHHN